jgi:hypothetical protein
MKSPDIAHIFIGRKPQPLQLECAAGSEPLSFKCRNRQATGCAIKEPAIRGLFAISWANDYRGELTLIGSSKQ